MKIEYIPNDEFKAIVKAAHRGINTVLDTDLNVTKCIHHDGGYIVVDDNHAVTVLRVDESGFVSEIKDMG